MSANNGFEYLEKLFGEIKSLKQDLDNIQGSVTRLESCFKQQFAPMISEQEALTIDQNTLKALSRMSDLSNDGDESAQGAVNNYQDFLKYVGLIFLTLKKKHPATFLWAQPIFNTETYKQFESQLPVTEGKILEAIPISPDNISSDAEPEVSLINDESNTQNDTSAAEIYQKLNLIFTQASQMFGNLNASSSSATAVSSSKTRAPAASSSAKASSSSTSTSTSRRTISSKAAPISSLLNITGSSSAPGSSSPGIPSSSISAISNTPSTAPPEYHLSRTISTLTDLWKEFAEGLEGSPAVRDLEETYGVAWRRDRTESRFFCRRKELYDYIKETAKKRKSPEDEIVKELEDERVSLGHLSIDAYRKILKKRK